MNNPLSFPESTLVNRLVAKDRFYQQDSSLRDWLTREVESIVWLYKLTPQTLHVSPSEGIEEVDVFLLAFKPAGHDKRPVERIAKLIPRPTLFLFSHEEYALRIEGLSIESVYYGLLSQLEGLDAHTAAEYHAQQEERDRQAKLAKQIEQLERKARKETQHRRRYELFQQITQLKENAK